MRNDEALCILTLYTLFIQTHYPLKVKVVKVICKIQTIIKEIIKWIIKSQYRLQLKYVGSSLHMNYMIQLKSANLKRLFSIF